MKSILNLHDESFVVAVAVGFFLATTTANANNANAINIINITKIQTIAKTNPQVYDTFIDFKMEETTAQQPLLLESWSIGFFMPRTFDSLVVNSTSTNINPDLEMKICTNDENDAECAVLFYVTVQQQQPKMNNNNNFVVYYYYYGGDGYTNVLKPLTDDFPLLSNHTYKILLLNSNQWAPANIAAMPQSFFLRDETTNNDTIITAINVDLSAYGVTTSTYGEGEGESDNNGSLNSYYSFFENIGGYDNLKVQSSIEKHLYENWYQNSQISSTSTDDDDDQTTINKLGLIPSPYDSIVEFDPTKVLDLTTTTTTTTSKKSFTYHNDFDNNNNNDQQQQQGQSINNYYYDQTYISHVVFDDLIKFVEDDDDDDDNHDDASAEEAAAADNNDNNNSFSIIRIDHHVGDDNNNNNNNNDPEGYVLRITVNSINIEATNGAGVFYALQTLRQLVFLHNSKLPILHLVDKPQFQYRGLMIDVSRHYSTIPELKTMIDAMSTLKLNTLHVHFADDEGFRLELPNSLLTGDVIQKAAYRGFVANSTTPPAMMFQANQDLTNYEDFDPTNGKMIQADFPTAITRYGLYYSKNDIRELIDYANRRQVTIIPEIDIPGHAGALTNSMRSMFVNPLDDSEYISVQGYYNDILPICLYGANTTQGEQFTLTMNQIIRDVSDLFANQTTLYAKENEVSIGGDEVSANAWSNDTSCENQPNLSALERSQRFFKELQEANPNIKLSGWQQFVQTDDGPIGDFAVNANSTAHTWVWNPTKSGGINDASTLANSNYPTVLVYADYLYFDLTYTPNAWEPGFYWASNFSDTHAALSSAIKAKETLLEVGKDIGGGNTSNILGLEGTLWTEVMTNERHMQYMAFPKITGLAEASWSPLETTAKDNKPNWQSLAKRLGLTDQNGVLGYLNKEFGVVYRGMPYGISKEIPPQVAAASGDNVDDGSPSSSPSPSPSSCANITCNIAGFYYNQILLFVLLLLLLFLFTV